MRNLERDFDCYQRYSVLAGILHSIFEKELESNQTVKVLDVGAGAEAITKQFLNEGFEIIRADTINNDVDDSIVIIEGEPLPFQNQSFDVVISMDVLEHVPSDSRQLFIHECSRVAKSLCLIAAPNGDPDVRSAESRVYEMYKKHLGEHAFFEEHAGYGLPNSEQVVDWLTRDGFYLVEMDNVLLSSWEAFTTSDIAAYSNETTLPYTVPMHQWQNSEIHGCYEGCLHYRKFYLSSRDNQVISLIKDYKSKNTRKVPYAEFDNPLQQMAYMHINFIQQNIGELKNILEEKESYITGLEGYCNEFREAIKVKDNHIEGLDQFIQGFKDALIAKDKQIENQEAIIKKLQEK